MFEIFISLTWYFTSSINDKLANKCNKTYILPLLFGGFNELRYFSTRWSLFTLLLLFNRPGIMLDYQKNYLLITFFFRGKKDFGRKC